MLSKLCNILQLHTTSQGLWQAHLRQNSIERITHIRILLVFDELFWRKHRKLGQNQLDGSLPGEWASGSAFQSLTELDVSANQLEGDLPVSYGAQGSFPGLQLLRLGSNAFTGVELNQELTFQMEHLPCICPNAARSVQCCCRANQSRKREGAMVRSGGLARSEPASKSQPAGELALEWR